MNVDEVVKRIVKTMRVREDKEGKQYGVIVMAEGLAEYLPMTYLKDVARDEHQHISVAQVNLNRRFARLVTDEYKRQTGATAESLGCNSGTKLAAPGRWHST